MGVRSLTARCGLSNRFVQIGVSIVIAGISICPAHADKSPFDFPEAEVQPSPSEAKKIKLADGETIVDFDVAPTRPEAAVISKTSNGKQKLGFWKFGSKDTDKSFTSWDIPSDLSLSAIAWHPLGNKSEEPYPLGLAKPSLLRRLHLAR